MATGSNDIEANMDEENKSDDEAEERLNILKLEKMKAKTSFTKTRRQLSTNSICQADKISWRLVRN